MIKEYVFKYKLFYIPWFYEFKCYADTTENAVAAFLKENPMGIEKYYIAFIVEV